MHKRGMNVKKDTNGILNNTIGILTWHYYTNFGSALQAYALKKKLKKRYRQTSRL